MRVTHVSTHDITGGAARAAFRLHEGLRGLGVESTMFVAHKASTSPHVIQARTGGGYAKLKARIRFMKLQRDMMPYRATRPAGYEDFDDDRTCDNGIHHQLPPTDILHLHFVSGFIDHLSFLRGLPPDLPVVWTAHDMAPLTGGCHYDAGCDRFTGQCGRCPQLGSRDENDLSHQVWSRKAHGLAALHGRLQFVVASRWMERETRRSGLCSSFPVACIPFGLDTDVFWPIDRSACKTALGIAPDARVVLFVSDSVTNRRKGLSVLLDALTRVREPDNIVMLSVGKSPPPASAGVRTHHLGPIANDRFLAIAYSAADAFVAPSLQEAFGQTVIEAMACGVPVIGFDTGGIPDLVRHGQTGLLCPTGDADALAVAIRQLLLDESLRSAFGQSARAVAEKEYSLSMPAQRHRALYSALVADVRRTRSTANVTISEHLGPGHA